jgi:hypothetical protein
MRIDGNWTLFSDGVTRPLIDGQLIDQSGQLVDVRFLVDCGADRTVLTHGVLEQLRLPLKPPPTDTCIRGISGQTDYVSVESVLVLRRSEGGIAKVRGEFLGLTDPAASDLCVLGRDVTDNFDLILSRRRHDVLLLAPTHQYQIVPT